MLTDVVCHIENMHAKEIVKMNNWKLSYCLLLLVYIRILYIITLPSASLTTFST